MRTDVDRRGARTILSSMLVPLDGTPESEAVLPLARTLAGCTGAEVLLLRVVPASASSADESEAVAHLQWTAAELRAGGLAVRADVCRGDPAEVIAVAASRIARIVVMSTHGGGGLARRLFGGGVADRVLARSTVPVLRCPPGARRPGRLRKVLVPIDGTDGDRAALAAAVDLASAARASMLLLHLVVPLYLYAPTADPFGAVLPGPHAEQEWDEAARRGARAHVDALAEQVVRLGVEAEGCALSGPVAETIVGAAEHARADVIVMSTHARTGPARAFYGSIAAAVVRGSGRPVLLVRRDASTWAPGGDRARGRRLAPASGG